MRRRPALRAPAGDGEVLAVPPLEAAADLVAGNRVRLADGPALLGRPFAELRELARRELIASAQAYTDTPAPRGDGPLFVAGHQPELFHPGVWVKNFALAGLARRHGGVAVNLIVDNDTLKSPSLRLPLPGERPRLIELPFDRAQGEPPWEERHVLDRAVFDRFGDEAVARLRGWGYEPLVAGLWAEVRRLAADRPLGAAFAAARRSLERRWGCHNLEVPISAVSGGEAFAWFVGAILGDLERFHADYNGVVRAYRARRRIRSRNHPVPDLARDGDWLEAPLWGWHSERPRRGRLFVRRDGDRLRLRAGGDDWGDVPAPSSRGFVTAWRDLGRHGLKARPRALMTTLFARLLPADLFVHGIGGGIYDELTDELIGRYFGLRPPEFLVLSATRRLPLPVSGATADDRRRLARRLRDVEFNPQRHLSAAEAAAAGPLLAERREWVQREPDTREGRRSRFRRLRELNDALRPHLQERREEVRRDFDEIDRRLADDAVLRRRDYSFCLYPEGVLRPLCERFL